MEILAKARSSTESYLCQRTNDYDCVEKQIDQTFVHTCRKQRTTLIIKSNK
ncbi:hypothetical protein DPMN_092430 [Dreissena polymorpha]|uniref:Uncharacterized protein n=1 Tax=Dreissena polymorpha TaxID=45954 RepID=A0A9D4L1B6_DREPO|nr:hypothetical protein DPMN_092430 [Dreissena polymorpha]